MARKKDYWIYQDKKKGVPWAIHLFAEREGRSKWYICSFAIYAEWIDNKSKSLEGEQIKISKGCTHTFVDTIKHICEDCGHPLDSEDVEALENELESFMSEF